MSSLWTPEGEHRVPRPDAGQSEPTTPAPGSAPPGAGPGPGTPPAPVDAGGPVGSGGPDEEEEALVRAEMAALERELLDAPAEDVVANHCYGLFQLAALHLGQQPPRLEPARLAIDAFAMLVEGLGERLGPATPTLRDGLAQIRLAFVQIAAAERPGGAPAGDSGPGDAG